MNLFVIKLRGLIEVRLKRNCERHKTKKNISYDFGGPFDVAHSSPPIDYWIIPCIYRIRLCRFLAPTPYRLTSD
jgi:hypothetical protein